MKWKLRISIVLNIILILWIIVLYALDNLTTNSLGEYSKDFDFKVKLQSNSYVINTYDNTLTKQLTWHKDTTIRYTIDLKYKKEIFDYLKKIDIYKYPSNYAPTSIVREYPSFNYYIQFTSKGVTRTIDWRENTCSETMDAKRLLKLFEKIQKIIDEDPRVKNLPEDNRAFL
jgi:hypothetical protein